MTGAGFTTRDLAAVARIEDHLLSHIRPHMRREDPALIVSWLEVVADFLNEERADRGLLARCDHCGQPITGACVFDDDEREWRSKSPEQWRRWHPRCRDDAAEADGLHRWGAAS